MMKRISLTLAMMIGGADLLRAVESENLKASANNALAVDVAGAIKDIGVVPESAVKAVDYVEPNRAGSVFQAESIWTGGYSFDALEQLGIRKDAEEKAVAKCQAQGLLGCVAIGSTLGACGWSESEESPYSCRATGIARSLVPVPGAPVFSAGSRWTGSDGFSALEQLGIRKDAEEKAIAKCQAQGLIGCVAIGSTLGACGWSESEESPYSCSATGMAQARTNPQ